MTFPIIRSFLSATFCTFVISSLFISTLQTHAQETPQITGVGLVPADQKNKQGLERSWFINTIEPGKTVTKQAEVVNYSDKEAKVQILAKDSLQSPDGTFTIIENGQANKEVGNWIGLSQNSLTLAAKSSKIIDVTIKVPENTKPGEYAGGILVQEAPKEDNSAVKLAFRTGSRVYVTVPGKLESGLKVEKFEFLQPKAQHYSDFITQTAHIPATDMYTGFNITNTGNIYVDADGEITIKGPDGETTKPIKIAGLAPRQEAVNRLENLQRQWKAGEYEVSFKLRAVPTVPTNKDQSLTTDYQTLQYKVTISNDDIEQMKKDKNQKSTQVKTPEENSSGASLDIKTSSGQDKPEGVKTDTIIIYVLSGLLAVTFAAFGIYFWKQKSSKK